MPYKEIALKETPTVEQFFKFIHKRHTIWYRRFVLKKPPPWTKDKILSTYRFTNVYRELDYGTVWSIRNIIEPREKRFRSQIVGAIAYRCCNRPETFEDNGIPSRKTDANVFVSKLAQYQDGGHPVFSSAYRASAFGPTPRLEIYRRILTEAVHDAGDLERGFREASSLESCWKLLCKRWGIGPFLAYEIVSDLMYGKRFRTRFSFNDFIVMGPGAKYGLEMMFGKLKPGELLEKIHWLREVQNQYLPDNFKGKELTAANVEDSLCEFRKYVSIQNGGGRPRSFTPRR